MGTWPLAGRCGYQHNLCLHTLEVEATSLWNVNYRNNGALWKEEGAGESCSVVLRMEQVERLVCATCLLYPAVPSENVALPCMILPLSTSLVFCVPVWELRSQIQQACCWVCRYTHRWQQRLAVNQICRLCFVTRLERLKIELSSSGLNWVVPSVDSK